MQDSIFDLLENDHSGRGHKQLTEEIFEMRMQIKRHMDAGLSAEDMDAARSLQQCVDAAEEVVAAIYNKQNA